MKPSQMEKKPVSISPAGEEFPLPLPEEYPAEFARWKKLSARHLQAVLVFVLSVGRLL